MTILKMTLMTITCRGFVRNSSALRPQNHKVLMASTTIVLGNQRHASSDSSRSGGSSYHTNHLTKAMALVSSRGHKLLLEKSKGKALEAGTAPSLKLATTKETISKQPLVVMLPWLMSKPKHVHKYAKLYLKLGFDVLTVRLTPWQLLWPARGSQLVAQDLLGFLEANSEDRSLLVHGFSVGGYLWGELMGLVEKDRDRYLPVVGKIVGHVWDSAADMQDIEMGFPVAVFPKNLVLQKAVRQYIRYHMRTFYEGATQHYIRSSQMFHSSNVRSPALMMFSERDPIGNPESNMRVRDNWEALGIKTYVKCWEKSPHVGHYHRYPEEYVAEVAAFLASIGLLPVACKMAKQAKV